VTNIERIDIIMDPTSDSNKKEILALG